MSKTLGTWIVGLLLLSGVGAVPAMAVPPLVLTGITISDPAPGGNGDGALEQGETATIDLQLVNIASIPLTATGSLSYQGPLPGVTILQSTATWDSMPPNRGGGVFTNAPHFAVQVPADLSCGQVLNFTLIATPSSLSTATLNFSITLGLPPQYDFVTSATTRSDENDTTISGAAQGDGLGWSVTTGDYERHFQRDVAIGALDARLNGRGDSGTVYVVNGQPTTLPDIDLLSPPAGVSVIAGAQEGDELGAALATGDLNHDGMDDLIMAAPGGDGPPGPGACFAGTGTRCESGTVYVLFGVFNTPPPNIDLSAPPANVVHIWGPQANLSSNIVLATGDVDGDGFPDLVIAYPSDGPTQGGAVFIVYGRNLPWGDIDLSVPQIGVDRIFGISLQDGLGTDLSVADLDGDGRADVVMSAPGFDAPSLSNVGKVYILYGTAARYGTVNLSSPPASMSTILGADQGDSLGPSTVGDFNGDGRPDLILAAPSALSLGNARVASGEAYVFYTSIAQGTAINLLTPPSSVPILWGAASEVLGMHLATGDLNGDGYDDLLMQSELSKGSRTQAGRILAVFGSPTRWSSIDLTAPLPKTTAFYGADAGDRLGSAIVAADLDGDGLDDLLAGAAFADSVDNSRPDGGELSIWYGKPQRTYTPSRGAASFIDLSATGTAIPGLACDDCEVAEPIGFNFQYDAQTFSQVYVSSNGFISFKPVGNSLRSSTPECMPNVSPDSGVNGEIAPFWSDLNPSMGGQVLVRTDGVAPNRRTTFEWLNVPHYFNTGAVTFEVSLFEATGEILMQYQDVEFGDPALDGGLAAVAGVEDLNGHHGVPWSCFSNSQIGDGMAVRFKPDTPITEQTAERGLGLWFLSPAGLHLGFGPSGNHCEPDQHGGQQSWYAGSTSSCNYTTAFPFEPFLLNAPTIPALPSDALLSYSFRHQVDAGHDPAVVTVSTTGPTGGRTTIDSPADNSGTWQTVASPISLASFAGLPVDMQFSFTPDNSGNLGIGWMIDDLRINGCNAAAPGGGTGGGASVAVYATNNSYCSGGSSTLDGAGSFCPDGSAPLGSHWLLGGVEVGTGATFTVPATQPPGSYGFTLRIDCPGPAQFDSPVFTLNILGPPGPVGDTLMVTDDTVAGTLTFTWVNVPNATGYNVVANNVANGTFPFLAGSATDGTAGLTTSLFTAPALFFAVVGTNACGTGPAH